jgi:hypothetical protein
MTTVKSLLSSSKAKIVIPSIETKSTSASEKKEISLKNRPEFVVRTNYPDSNAPLGVSVSKFNRTHIVVRNKSEIYKLNLIFS